MYANINCDRNVQSHLSNFAEQSSVFDKYFIYREWKIGVLVSGNTKLASVKYFR